MVYPNSLLFKNIVYCSVYLICIVFTVIAIRHKNHRQLVDFFEQLPPIVCIVIFLSCWAAFYGVSLSLDPTFDKDTSNKLMLISAISVVICIAYVVFKYLLASQRSGTCSFCIRTDDSKDCSNCYSVICSNKVRNSFFIQDCFDLDECMFCAHIASKRFCIANMQFEEEEYYEIKKAVVSWILNSQ